MPANKRPRKKYRPKARLVDPVSWFVEGVNSLVGNKPSEWLTVRIKVHDALLRLMRGESTRDSLDILVSAANLSRAMQDVCQIGAEHASDTDAAHLALLAVCRRPGHVGTSAELNAIRAMVELHDAQLDACTVRQFERAIEHVQRELRHGRAIRIMDGSGA